MRPILLLLMFFFSMQAVAMESKCDGAYKGMRLTKERLNTVLDEHSKWLADRRGVDSSTYTADTRRANLCEVDLSGANLSGANLSEANLSEANLSGANLSEANLSEANLSEANLSEANLSEANLSEANLSEANLSGANLWSANLSRVDLSQSLLVDINLARANLSEANLNEVLLNWSEVNLIGVNLSGVNLIGVNLSGVYLGEADLSRTNLSAAILHGIYLSGANLSGAILIKADLQKADLSRANLSRADLSWAKLSEADLSGANLNNTDVRGIILDFKPLSDVLGFKGVSSLSYIEIVETNPILALRDQFKEVGFKNEDKALTSAIRKRELIQASFPEYALNMYLLGGLLTDFGADPLRPVIALFTFILVFFWFYLVALQQPEEDNGIWRLRPKNRILKKSGDPEQELIPFKGFWRTIPIALYFSILSAFHFGWREINLGSWIVRLQRREYTLAATGWVRSTSGVQSLISLYLIALSLLTYFGRPFE